MQWAIFQFQNKSLCTSGICMRIHALVCTFDNRLEKHRLCSRRSICQHYVISDRSKNNQPDNIKLKQNLALAGPIHVLLLLCKHWGSHNFNNIALRAVPLEAFSTQPFSLYADNDLIGIERFVPNILRTPEHVCYRNWPLFTSASGRLPFYHIYEVINSDQPSDDEPSCQPHHLIRKPPWQPYQNNR